MRVWSPTYFAVSHNFYNPFSINNPGGSGTGRRKEFFGSDPQFHPNLMDWKFQISTSAGEQSWGERKGLDPQ
ncbi:MAG: hypothetical protein CM15mP9_4700 [Methanobacteriota archaeon]|nr:MAG: hypothetical protein CM15mP9_4700 [Euryarchaeota archaeon]